MRLPESDPGDPVFCEDLMKLVKKIEQTTYLKRFRNIQDSLLMSSVYY